MTTSIAATTALSADVMEQVVMAGDLAKLSPADRLLYYQRVCESLGLNPLTQPFSYIRLNGKLTLYARKDCTDQLRKRDDVSIEQPDVQVSDEMCIVRVKASLPNGRTDAEVGAVALEGLNGDARANAIMKAVTKAKRRVTLSICGLGWLDESEVEPIPEREDVIVDQATGEIRPQLATLAAPATPRKFVAVEAANLAAHSLADNWCPLHSIQWFQRGKMRSFAHPPSNEAQKQGEAWCYRDAVLGSLVTTTLQALDWTVPQFSDWLKENYQTTFSAMTMPQRAEVLDKLNDMKDAQWEDIGPPDEASDMPRHDEVN